VEEPVYAGFFISRPSPRLCVHELDCRVTPTFVTQEMPLEVVVCRWSESEGLSFDKGA
jgi:hypothetical protein